MDTTKLTTSDKTEIFQHQRENGPFSAMAQVAAGLNYLDRLNRKRLDRTAAPEERTAALRKMVPLEMKLYAYAREQTPLSLFDVDYRQEAEDYIQMRTVFLKATTLTFHRHRLAFLLDLIKLYTEDPCQILVGRKPLLEKWEKKLLYEYLLYDMSKFNTDDVGKEAISNGYHECDFTLDIEDIMKHPMKAVPRQYFPYVVKSLSVSRTANYVIAYMKEHINELAPALWVVDAEAIWEASRRNDSIVITEQDIAMISATYQQ